VGVVRVIVAWLATLAGIAAVVYGVWLMWPPLGWLAAGVVVAFVGAAELVGDRRR